MITVKQYCEYTDFKDSEIDHLDEIIEFNKALVEKYPWLNRCEVWDKKQQCWVKATLDDSYTNTWFDDIPRGWRIAFGLELCEKIQKILEENWMVDTYMIGQIKEKFGYLRWYHNCAVPEELEDLIREYEDISWHTCINCGKPAKWQSTGWIYPFCDDCKGKNDIPIE